MMGAFHLSIGALSGMTGAAHCTAVDWHEISPPVLNLEIEDHDVIDDAQRLRFECFMLGMDNIGIARRDIAKRHDEAVCQTLIVAFRAAIGAGDIIVNSRNRFGQIQKILEELGDLFVARSIFKLQQDNVFYLRHVELW
jgi:hypothetical protein